ncbi:HXXEE domain-containing protein [Paenibacillus sp. MBLB2552]|uniref:HXXEE domain-containing protein n=1 Tax=Paenibacillus mellifer TaxID=2937794 RepID=A0A9X1Y5H0_9BACL|nr:HXXEE domain-containing protein [Paenibacillus mellifer]MCK8487672.1 HXXEE domain-containing protein [Paenibacillus mellifer]
MDNLSVTSLVWLFLVSFVIHDMEEIIWVGPWAKRNRHKVAVAVPPRMKRSLTQMLNITSSQFAVAVLLEFIVFVPFTLMAAEQGRFFIFLSFNTLFFLHVFTHVAQSVYLKMYTPGVVTAVLIVLPYSLLLFHRLLYENLVTWGEILLSIPVGLLVVPLVLVGHELGKRWVKS